ncbi:MAG: hypothetical protein HFI15_09420 [Lachnospiraceae bacterium]|nr:hypothetical protein [Lachnospiraceae bacterium]
MNVAMISSLNTYTKTMKMQMKWQQRQSSGDYTSKTTSGNTSDGTSAVDRILREQQEKAAERMKQSASSVSREQIDTKLRSGKKLSAAEMEYLKEHDPQTYEKARKIQMEREAFERELKKCRTKEEVQRVKLSHAAASMAAVKEADTNPNIPKGQKLALIMQELAKNNALCDAERAFIQSGDYGRLPTENERLKAEEDLKKAEEAEKDMENRTDDTPEEVNDSLNETAAGKAVEEKARAEEKTPSESRIKAAKEIIAGKKPTRMQAEVTPEARKVRRAKAQAAYAMSSFTGTPSGSIDIKVT